MDDSVPPTKPYLIRALYDWCVDNGFTPYLSVAVDGQTRVPAAFVKDGQITLNISVDATQNLNLGNDEIQFAARFNGVATSISVPIGRVLAVYARENGVGMGFPVVDESDTGGAEVTSAGESNRESGSGSGLEISRSDSTDLGEPGSGPAPSPKGDRPTLKRIK